MVLMLGIVLAVLALILVWRIRRGVEDMSRTMFGTKSFREGYERQKEELSERPRSVSGMTDLCLPRVQKDFPEFDYYEFKRKAENALITSLMAVTEGNAGRLKDVSANWRDKVSLLIRQNRAENRREAYSRVKIHQTEIARYVKEKGKCILLLQSAVEYFHYIEKDGKIVSGSKEQKEQVKYNIELIYVQDESQARTAGPGVGLVCPQCGAPVKTLGMKVCEYCGTPVKEINLRIWKLNSFYLVS